MSVPTKQNFDYEQIEDKEARSKLQRKAQYIHESHKKIAGRLEELWQHVHEAHQIFSEASSDGLFTRWCEGEFDWSRAHAYNFINAFKRLETRPKFRQLLGQFAPSAVYLLSRPNTPKEAVDTAIKRADRGRYVTHDAAKKLVEQYKPQESRSEPSPPPDESPAPEPATGGDGEDSGPLEGELLDGETDWDNLPQQEHVSDPDPYRVATLELKAAAKHISAKHHLDDDQALSLFQSAAAELEREWDEGDSYEP